MEPQELLDLWQTREDAIENARNDPYRYGFALPHWKYADELLCKFRTLLLLGANRSGKTRYCARKIIQAAMDNPNGLIFCFGQTHEISVTVQQRAVWEALPAEYRVKKVNDGNISFTYKNGFSDKKMVFPNGTIVIFKTYTQYQQDDTILEGMELGSPEPVSENIGCWLDEYLLGMEMIDRLMLRLATHNAKLLISFTPKDGETETVRNYRDGADTVESRFVSEGLKTPRTVPYVQHNERMNTGISYFHSKDNPWSGYESLLEQCIAKGDDDYTLTALYGVPTKNAASLFPRFQEQCVVTDEFIAEKLKNDPKTGKPGCSRFHIIDPAGSKPWFMLWIAVDPTDTWYVYREWPSMDHGPWAEQKGGKWVAGEACRQKLGYGVKDYVDLIRDLEAGEDVYERWIDPRAGAAKYSKDSGGQSDYITDLNDHGMYVAPAPRGMLDGKEEDHGIQLIQNRLSYNPQKPIDAENRPRLYVSNQCGNLIKALQEYDKSSREHPLKDPLDCLRYAAEAEIIYMNENSFKAQRKGKGGY